MKINFKSNCTEGDEHVMLLDDMVATEIRFNYKTREIFVVYKDATPIYKYSEDELGDMHYTKVKKLVIENDGEWSNTADGRKFLLTIV